MDLDISLVQQENRGHFNLSELMWTILISVITSLYTK